jgi:hypothetical protein
MPLLPKFLLAAALSLICGVTALGQSPRLYLKFDKAADDAAGGVTDSSGAGIITSILTSSGYTRTYAPDRNGVADKALLLPGSASLRLSAPTTFPGDATQALGIRPGANQSGTNAPFTLAAWVYIDSNTASGYNTIFGGIGTGTGTLHAGMNFNSSVTRAHFGFDGGDANGGTVAFDQQQWYHVAFVYTGGQQRIYINGVPEITRVQATNTLKVSDLLIGNWNSPTDASNDLKGRLDDVVVFNSALNANQIQALFQGVDPTNASLFTSSYIAPKIPGVRGAVGTWGVREIKAYSGGIANGNLVNADRIARAYASVPGANTIVAEYQTPVINLRDPEAAGPTNAGVTGTFAGDAPFGTNTGTGDDNIVVVAKCAVQIPTTGAYTFGFRGDDGARLRIIGRQFTGATAVGGGNVASPVFQGDAIYFPGSSTDSATLGVVSSLPAGTYNLELVYFENNNTSSIEVFAAPGSKSSIDGTFKLVGDTANGGLALVADPDIPQITTFTANGTNSLFVHNGSPSSFTLAWSTNAPATTRTISPDVGGPIEQAGSRTLATPAQNTSYTFTASNNFGDTTTKTVNVYLDSAPIISGFTFTGPGTPGGDVTLSWNAEGATTLTLNGASVTGQSSAVVNSSTTSVFTLVATNPAGTTQQTIALPVINSFSASDANPLYGGESVLSWSTTNADTVSLNQGFGTVPTSGNYPVTVLQTTTYILTASNAHGSTTASVVVNQATPIGVRAGTGPADGFTVKRYNSNTNFPFPGMGYLQSAETLIANPSFQSGAPITVNNVPSINYNDNAEGDFIGSIGFPGGGGNGINFALHATGTLIVNTPGEYTFILNCDDGARLRVDGQDVIVDDGTHSPSSSSGRIMITKPSVPIELVYYNAPSNGGTAGAGVELGWIRPNLSWQLLGTVSPAPAIVRGQVLISEFVADNNDTLIDEDGASSDWIEIWNSTNATVNLGGYFLTDDASVPNKWPLPAWTLGANQYLLVFASGKNRTPAQAVAGQDNPGTAAQPRMHTNFSLSNNGEYLALTKADGAGGFSVLTSFAPAFPPQREDVSYGSTDTEGYVGYMETPTPGFTNAVAYADFVADTNFSHLRGRYSAPFNLALSTVTPGATIRYTTNGSTPSLSQGTIYNGPISINKTTVVRAIAFKPGWKPTNVDTQTYLFLDDVISQNDATAMAVGFPPPGRLPNDRGQTPEQVMRYGMNLANVTAAGGNANDLKNALSAAPTVCMTTDLGNLIDRNTGIYVNAQQHGLEWERPTSIEYINAAGTSEFQIDCGVRIRGGFSRSGDNPKHAFHLYFRGSLYDGDLKYRLFGANGASRFDQIDMRCEQNYSWSFQNGTQNSLMREEWARKTQLDMGQPGSRSGYFHLYINGIYWGIYNWEERTEADFGASYLGGEKDNIDTVKSAGSSGGYNTEMTDGNFISWKQLYDLAIQLRGASTESTRTALFLQMQGLNPDGTRNLGYPVLLDPANLIDYNLITFYDGSFDSPLSTFLDNASNNWFGVRDRQGARGFAFFVHDHEHGMDSTGTDSYNRVGPWGELSTTSNNWNQTWLASQYGNRHTFSKSNPQYLHELLAFSAEYRQWFADRVQKHFFNGGALTKQKSLDRANELAAQVEPIIHAEAARWGSASLHKNTWLNTAKQTVLNFINNGGAVPPGHPALAPGDRTSIVLQQLKGYQDPINSPKPLFPSGFDAPTVSGSFGGAVSQPYTFTLSNPNGAGAIYYTVNGLDPRPIGGGAPVAGAATGASPISVTLNNTATVRARVYNSATQAWSPLIAPEFLVGALASPANLVISEIHYNPAGPGDATEFIEVMNISAMTVDLTNVRVLLGLQFTFPNGFTLAPGARALVVRDAAAFSAAYPNVPSAQVAGVFANATSLENGGEQLQLVDASGAVIRDFTYDNNFPWPDAADGDGPSLVLIRPETNPNHTLAQNWRASSAAGGNPGAGDALGYGAWAAANGVNDPSGTADVDGDGLNSFVEYALGTSPSVSSGGALPTVGEQNVNVGGVTSPYLTITFTRPVGRDDVAFSVESGTSLGGSWGSGVLVGATRSGTNETLTFRHPQPKTAGGQQFLRVRFTKLQ